MAKAASKNSVKHRHHCALLIMDMLNPFDFPEAKKLHPFALKAAKSIRQLKQRAKKYRLPVLYVNDNFGMWQSDWKVLYEKCTEEKALGKEIAEILHPDEDDYFVLKPKHSGFHATCLDLLLQQMGVKKIILTGIAGNICILFTAHDALMREYEVLVPKDCIGSNTAADNSFALRQLNKVFDIKTTESSKLGKKDFS